jgi:flagellar protein FlaJ
MELKLIHWIGIAIGVATAIIAFFFQGSDVFFFLMGIGIVIIAMPFVITLIKESRIANEKEEMFLEFARNLVESVKTGTPISKSIVNMKNKPFGVLSENIRKLANQISLGIPLNQALHVFAQDVNNVAISRVLTLIGQAERAGGDIGEILESVARAVSLSDELKKERKSIISTLVVQGYIIFFVFLVIILIMQFRILPMLEGLAEAGGLGIAGIGVGAGATSESIKQIGNSFLYLLLIQGLFSGLAIGKLSEGSLKAGIKHSFALMVASFLISTMAGLAFGS